MITLSLILGKVLDTITPLAVPGGGSKKALIGMVVAVLLLVIVMALIHRYRNSRSGATGGSSGRSIFSRFGSSGSTGGSGGGGRLKVLALVALLLVAGFWLASPLKAMMFGRTKTIEITRTPPTPDGPKDVFELQPESVVFLWENERGETKEVTMSSDNQVTIPEKAALLFKVFQPKTVGMGETTPGQSPFRLVAWKTGSGGYEVVKQGKNLPYPSPGKEMMLIDYYHFSIGRDDDGSPRPEKVQVTVGPEGQTTLVDAFVELVVDIDLDETRLPNYGGTPDQLLRDQRDLYEKVMKTRAEYLANMSSKNFSLDTQTGLGGKVSCVTQADDEVRKGNDQLLSSGKPFKLAVKTCYISK